MFVTVVDTVTFSTQPSSVAPDSVGCTFVNYDCQRYFNEGNLTQRVLYLTYLE